MKKVLTFLPVALLVAVSAIWWTATNQLKNSLPAHIEFDSMKRTGFPFSPKIELKNPRTEALSHFGVIQYGTSLLGTQGWVDFSGKTKIDDMVFEGKFSLYKGNLKSFLKGAQLDEMSPGQFFSLLDDFTLKAENLSISAPTANIEIQTGVFKLSSYDPIHLDFSADIQGMAFGNEFTQAFPKNLTDISFKGKSSHSLRGLKEGMNIEDILPMGIELDSFVFSDQFSSGSLKMACNFDSCGDDRYFGSFSFSSLGNYHSSPALPEKSKFLASLRPINAEHPWLATFLENYWDDLSKLLPDMVSFGTTKTDIDFGFEFGLNQDRLEISEFKLNRLQLDSDKYGLNVHGIIAGSEEEPSYNLTLAMKNHRDCISDLLNYYNKWQTVLSNSDLLGPQLPQMNERVANKVSAFLESMAQRQNDRELLVTLQHEHPKPVTVCDKSLDEILLALQQLSLDVLAELQLESKIEPSTENVLMSPAPL